MSTNEPTDRRFQKNIFPKGGYRHPLNRLTFTKYVQGGYFMADQSELRLNSLFMDNSGLFKYRVLLDIVLRLIIPNLKALAIK